jgi:hypothetical protein
MTYCTVVEFEWDGDFDHEGFRRTQAFAKQSAPLLATVPMPPPSRVTGFEVTSYEVA